MHLCWCRLPPGRVHAHGAEGDAGHASAIPFVQRGCWLLRLQPRSARGGWGGRQCTRSSRAAGSLGPTAALPPHARKGNWRGARELTKFWGEVVSGGGTREPARAPLTPKLEGTCSVRGQRRAEPAPTRASPAPHPPHWLPRSSGRGRTRELRSERGCWGALDRPGLDRAPAPALTAAKCRGPIGPGITRARADEGMRASGQGPQRRRRGWATRDGSAVTFRDPQPRQPAGGARALRGPDPRGPARARQAGPLLAGARRSQHMVRGGAPPRPAETGCSRYRIRDRQRDAGPGLGRPHARPGRRRQGWGAGGRVWPGWPRLAWVGGQGAPGSPARANLIETRAHALRG